MSWAPHKGAPDTLPVEWKEDHVARFFRDFFRFQCPLTVELNMTESQVKIIQKLLEKLEKCDGDDIYDANIIELLENDIFDTEIRHMFLKGVKAFKTITDYNVNLVVLKHPNPDVLEYRIVLYRHGNHKSMYLTGG